MLRNLKYKTISNSEILQSGIVLRGKGQKSVIIGSLGLPPTPEHQFYFLIKLENYRVDLLLCRDQLKKTPTKLCRLSLQVTNMMLLFLLHKVLHRKLQLCVKC